MRALRLAALEPDDRTGFVGTHSNFRGRRLTLVAPKVLAALLLAATLAGCFPPPLDLEDAEDDGTLTVTTTDADSSNSEVADLGDGDLGDSNTVADTDDDADSVVLTDTAPDVDTVEDTDTAVPTDTATDTAVDTTDATDAFDIEAEIEVPLNACGGEGEISPGEPGSDCGPCADGELVCASDDPAHNTTVCVGASSLNACGTCGALDRPLDADCGECGRVVCGTPPALTDCIEPTGGCETTLTCDDLDCEARFRECQEGNEDTDASCLACFDGYVDVGGVCLPLTATPDDLTATLDRAAYVDLAWSAVEGATGYQVERCPRAACTLESDWVLLTETPLTQPTYRDETALGSSTPAAPALQASEDKTDRVSLDWSVVTVEPAEVYLYRVYALSESGASGPTSPVEGGRLSRPVIGYELKIDAGAWTPVPGGLVTTWDHLTASPATVVVGQPSASQGTHAGFVRLAVTGSGTTPGPGHSYMVRAVTAAGGGVASAADLGRRVAGAMSFQWQRSVGVESANFQDIAGATAVDHDDTLAPLDGNVRYYRVVVGAVGASPVTSAAVYGFRALPAPAGLSATTSRDNDVQLVWNSVPNVSGYRVYRCDGEACVAGSTWYQLTTTPIAATTYSDTTALAPAPPAAPDLAAPVGYPDRVALSWSEVTAPQAPRYHYRVTGVGPAGDTDPSTSALGHRSDRPLLRYEMQIDAGAWTAVPGGLVTTWDDNAAPKPTLSPMTVTASRGTFGAHVALAVTGAAANPGAARSYAIRAVSAIGVGAASTVRQGTTLPGPLGLAWQRSAQEADGFVALAGATGATFEDTTAPADGTTRYYRVIASATGATAVTSAVVPGFRAPPSPSNLVATTDRPGDVQLTWTGVANIDGYHVERCAGATCTNDTDWTRLTTSAVTGTSYTDATALAPASPPSPSLDIPVSHPDRIALTWSAIAPPLAPKYQYRIIGTGVAGETAPSSSAQGQRSERPLLRYEIRVDGGAWSTVAASVTSWEDTDAPRPTLSAISASASQGAHAAHVALSLTGAGSTPGALRSYEVRAVTGIGASPASNERQGRTTAGPLSYVWQRSAVATEGFNALAGATAPSFSDTTAPADGSTRYYRAIVSAAGATDVTSAVVSGFRSPPAPGGINATTDRLADVELTWGAVANVTGYHVERCAGAACGTSDTWTRITGAPISALTYSDTTALAPAAPPAPTLDAPVSHPDHVALTWSSVDAPVAQRYSYRVIGVGAAGETPPSAGALGHRADRPLLRYELRIDGGTWTAVPGGLVTSWSDTAAPRPTLAAGIPSASQGLHAAHVALSVSGSSSTPGTTRNYEVRAVSGVGPSAGSNVLQGRTAAGSLSFVWQRSAVATEGFTNLAGATGSNVSDATAPADGSTRYYRVIVSAAGATDVTSAAVGGFRTPPAPSGLSATTDQPNDVQLTWSTVPNVTAYHVERCAGAACGPSDTWTRITSSPVATPSYSDATALAPSAPPAPTLGAPVSHPDQVALSWSAVVAPAAPRYSYRVVGVGPAGETQPSTSAAGNRADRPVTGYETRIDGGTWTAVPGGLVTTWADVAAARPTLFAGVPSASSGTHATRVALSVTGTLSVPGVSRTYEVRAVSGIGPSPASSARTGQTTSGALTYAWQRSSVNNGGFTPLSGATSAAFDDTTAPADGSTRYYRVTVSATGAADVTSPVVSGFRAPPAPANLVASVDRTTEVELSWDDVANVTAFHVERCDGGSCAAGDGWTRLTTEPVTVTTYTDTTALGPAIPPAPTLQAPVSQPDRVELSWSSVTPPQAARYSYRVVGVTVAGETSASSSAAGHRADPTLTGYEVKIDAAAWVASPGGLATSFADLDAPRPTLVAGTPSATQGTIPAHVALSVTGAASTPGTLRSYQVRAVTSLNIGSASTARQGQTVAGTIGYQWQRSSEQVEGFSPLSGATTATFQDTTAPANGSTRYYRVVVSAAGANPVTSSVVAGYRTPSSETGLTATTDVVGVVELAWGSVPNAIGYHVERCTGSICETGGVWSRLTGAPHVGTSYTDSTALPPAAPPAPTLATPTSHPDKVALSWTAVTPPLALRYYYRLVAVTAAGDGLPSAGVLGHCADLALTRYEVKVDSANWAVVPGGLVTTWDDVGAPAPTLTAGTPSASAGTFAAHVALGVSGATSTPGAQRTYQVRAVSDAGTGTPSSARQGQTVSGPVTYAWQRSTTEGGAFSPLAGATSASFNDATAPDTGSTNYYRVVVSATGATSVTSATVPGFRTPPPPTGVAATTDLANHITVSWNAVPNVSGYHVERCSGAACATGGTWDRITEGAPVAGVSFNDIGALGASVPPAPTLSTPVAFPDKVALSWSSVTAPQAPRYYYRIVALAPASTTPSASAIGNRLDSTLARYEYKIDAGAWTTVPGGLVTAWDDTAAPRPTLTAGTPSASAGLHAAHVALSLTGAASTPGTLRTYQVRAVSDVGAGTGSAGQTGQTVSSTLSYVWQRSTAAGGTFSDLPGATTPSFDDTTAPADGNTRYYKAIVSAPGATSVTSATVSGFRAPPAPTGVTATTYLADRVDVAWEAVANVSGYFVERCSGAACATGGTWTALNGTAVTGLTYSDTTAAAAAVPPAPTLNAPVSFPDKVALSWSAVTAPQAPRYYYRVKGVAPAGNTAPSASAIGNRLDQPLTRYELKIGAGAWTTISGGLVTAYDDTAAPRPTLTAGTPSASAGLVAAHVALSLTGATSAPGTLQTYQVRAVSDVGPGTASTSRQGQTTSAALTYAWQRSSTAGGEYTALAGATATTFNDTTAPADGSTVYYRVVVSATGANSVTSAVVSGFRAPPSPTGLTATIDRPTDIKLDWSSVPNVTGYHVYRCSGASCTTGGTWTKLTTTATTLTTYTDAPGASGWPAAPAAPVLFTPTNGSDWVTLTFSNVTQPLAPVYHYRVTALAPLGETGPSATTQGHVAERPLSYEVQIDSGAWTTITPTSAAPNLTWNDTGAPAPTLSVISVSASKGTYAPHVELSVAATSTAGASRTYLVRAKNTYEVGPSSGSQSGYRNAGNLTYDWYRSAGTTPSNYSLIDDDLPATYQDTVPSAGAHRWYTVTVNAAGASSISSAAVEGWRLPIPTAPANVTPTRDILTKVNVTWSAVSDASSYHVYRDGVKVTTGNGVAGTSYDDSGAGAPTPATWPAPTLNATTSSTNYVGLSWQAPTQPLGTNHTYTVTAVNANGESPQSVGVSGRRGGPALIGYRLTAVSGGNTRTLDLGNVTSYNDTDAPGGTISAAGTTISATQGTLRAHVALATSGGSTTAGATVTYQVRALVADDSPTPQSSSRNGNRSIGTLTRQWQRSAGTTSTSFTNLALGCSTSTTCNDTGAPSDGMNRWYQVVLSASGATSVVLPAVSGWRLYFESISSGGVAFGSTIAATCATTRIDPDGGRVWCWGDNSYGQLGRGMTSVSESPGVVPNLNGVAQVVVGGYHVCARKLDGTVWCWGNNTSGQLGNATVVDQTAPVQVTGLTGASDVATGGFTSCAVLGSGQARCWGQNGYGQVGSNSAASYHSTPQTVRHSAGTLTGLTHIAVASTLGSHACARDSSSGVWCWGSNTQGQLGVNPTLLSQGIYGRLVSGIASSGSLGAGNESTCATTVSGGAACWGDNSGGQLGNNSTSDSFTPVAVLNLSNVSLIASGGAHNCARAASGELRCWGGGGAGQLGNGSTSVALTPVAVQAVAGTDLLGLTVTAGCVQSCAVSTGMTPYCWGGNEDGQLGDGTTTNRTRPVAVVLP